MQFFFLGVKNGLAWRCQCWKHVKKIHQYFKINFRKSHSLNARHKWNQTHGEEETLLSKILSLPICASCMPNVLGFRRVFQHPRKVYFPTVRDSNVWDRKLHEIVNDKSQRVISSVLSSTKSFNESRVCERCT